jgi:hypothetical protein
MNLFILSSNPDAAAKAHADKHVVKMILEACQMLYTAHWITAYRGLLAYRSAVGISRAQKKLAVPPSMATAPLQKSGDQGYRPVHLHHPCTKWIRNSLENYLFAAQLAIAIGNEYSYRYGGKHHCMEHAKWLLANPPVLPSRGLQPFVMAMDPEYKVSSDPIECYQEYYRVSKGGRGLLQYTRRAPPEFLRHLPKIDSDLGV